MSENLKQFKKGALGAFFSIFISAAVVISISFFLFFHSIELNSNQIRNAAIMTFGNIVVLSALFWIFHLIRSYYTVIKPVRKIQEGLDAVTKGDFTVRIPLEKHNETFNAIIKSINRMTEELSSVETLKTDFISNVSHEIKTPISVIQNYSCLLQSGTLSKEEEKEYARIISDASLRLSGLVSNILKLNRLENQQIQLHTQRFDLSGHLTECLLSFEDIWEEKNIEIIPEITDSIFISSDPELLAIVWNNLFSNAFKFTEPGGQVYVTLKQEGQEAVVTVRDSGCGISPETAKHIFDKFYQGDTSHSAQGNGLGLALVKRIIDITGGEIRVNSTLGEGSEFTVIVQTTN
ncbi:MAG: HAMP domain-containing histidine kinase [Lachnospiraceae bacterium]|nr:HAMP domain-containing histidine kinase [Lachnospiraceae bacterium]